MLYGKPTKFIRHSDEHEFTLEPERMIISRIWSYQSNATARTDGQDLENSRACPLGSKILRHKMTLTITPETIEPQNLYMGLVKLSYHDVYATPVCGGRFVQASYEDTSTENFVAHTETDLGLYPDDLDSGATTQVLGADTAREFGETGDVITDILLDDKLKHFVNLKKVTVFDQRPLFTDRWQRIPSKVKRINEGTFYGLLFYNDSDRGATPADTQISVNLKNYWEEMAI